MLEGCLAIDKAMDEPMVADKDNILVAQAVSASD